jgi:hypothetical protein
VATAYREAAQRLGLQVDTRGVSVRGYLNDRRIWIGEVLERLGPERSVEVRGVVGFLWPLGLGLLIARRGSADRLLRRTPTRPLRTGNATLDGVIDVQADDSDLGAGLFSPAVVGALERLVRRWPGVCITDTEVSVRLRQPETTPDALRDLVHALTDAAEALEAARLALSPPRALLEGAAAWEATAPALGLELLPALPGLSGLFEGYRVLFSAHRAVDGYATTLSLWFQAHPDLGLLLRPQVEPDGYWSVGQDIQVGDPPFDAAFVIKGYDPHGVRLRLGPAVRAPLLRLRASGNLVVDDRGLVLSGLPPDPSGLRPLLADAVAAAKALGW